MPRKNKQTVQSDVTIHPMDPGMTIQECHKQFAGKEVKSSGTSGQVWETTDGKYIVKRIFRSSDMSDAVFVNEVMIGKLAHAIGVGPHLINAGRCGQSYYIVMEKLIPIETWTTKLIRSLAQSIDRLHLHHISHGSLHDDNMMIRPSDGRLVLIDYGHALLFIRGKPVPDRFRYRDYLSASSQELYTLEKQPRFDFIKQWVQSKNIRDTNSSTEWINHLHPWSLLSIGISKADNPNAKTIRQKIEQDVLNRDLDPVRHLFRVEV
jgi:hypothetical protein